VQHMHHKMQLAQICRRGRSDFAIVSTSSKQQRSLQKMNTKKIIKVTAITLGIIAFIGASGSVAIGGYVADSLSEMHTTCLVFA